MCPMRNPAIAQAVEQLEDVIKAETECGRAALDAWRVLLARDGTLVTRGSPVSEAQDRALMKLTTSFLDLASPP